ncbi:MAG: gamma-glutamyltransferase [Thermoanaerobaculia bacterium]
MPRAPRRRPVVPFLVSLLAVAHASFVGAAQTAKPPLHARHWLAITGKPLGATAGARIFERGGNAVDAACAMLAAVCTMWDTLGWGGETQALIYHPGLKKVIAINALGTAPTGATPAFFHGRGMNYPPEYGPLAAVVPGTPGGLFTMLAEYGTMTLADVLAPAQEMADGYAIEAQLANSIERFKKEISAWPASRGVFLPHAGAPRESPVAGEIFRQPDLKATLAKLVEAEAAARRAGKDRKQAIYAASERFYRGDIARELARGTQAEGGLLTEQDLADWKVKIEEPVSTSYRGIEVYKLDTWTQGPAMLQALNILETLDLKSMGYDSARYIHALYQAMNLAFADRDFYYGDPAFPPLEPLAGLLSKDYARSRAATIDWTKNDAAVKPGDPYPFQHGTNPFSALLAQWPPAPSAIAATVSAPVRTSAIDFDAAFRAGTTSIEAADDKGWVVSVTPSGGWVPAFVAGSTGIGLSQRMQSFVLDERESPFNVLEPGKRPRVTLTPTLALKDGSPWLAFAVQGGDTQDQNLLQFFLNVVEFGMTVQEATEAANVTSYQMHSSFGDHTSEPGRLTVAESMPSWVRDELRRMGYRIDTERLTSGPINAILIDREHGTLWGGSSQHGEDYGIAW